MLTDSFVEPGFLAAVCICLVTLLMPLFSRELRQSESIVVGYWFVVGLHQVVAFVNAYIFTGLGTPDSRGFQQWAEALAMSGDLRFLMGADFYKDIKRVTRQMHTAARNPGSIKLSVNTTKYLGRNSA